MSRQPRVRLGEGDHVPRARGDEPGSEIILERKEQRSPRTRG